MLRKTLFAVTILATSAVAAATPSPPAAPQIILHDLVELIGVVEQEPMARSTTVRAAVEIKIAEGYHVNANPPSEDWLIPTEISVSGAAGVTVKEAFYPEAQDRTFEFWPEPLRVYEGDVVMGFLLEISADAEVGPHDLELTLRYQACNEEACFAPTSVKYAVPVTVAEAGTAPRTTSQSPLLSRASFARPSQ